MKTMSANDAKARFDQFIDTAQQEPVVVTKKNHPVGVFLSIDHLEDTIWGEKAKEAHAEGYLTVEESAALLSTERPRFLERFFEQLRGVWGVFR